MIPRYQKILYQKMFRKHVKQNKIIERDQNERANHQSLLDFSQSICLGRINKQAVWLGYCQRPAQYQLLPCS